MNNNDSDDADDIYGAVAQLVAHPVVNRKVAGSSPVCSAIMGCWSSPVMTPPCHGGNHGFKSRTSRQVFHRPVFQRLEDLFHMEKVVGSSPTGSTNTNPIVL